MAFGRMNTQGFDELSIQLVHIHWYDYHMFECVSWSITIMHCHYWIDWKWVEDMEVPRLTTSVSND